MTRTELSAAFIAARKKAGYQTLYQLRKATGISGGTLDQIENKSGSPSVDTLNKIMAAIGWEVVIRFRRKKQEK